MQGYQGAVSYQQPIGDGTIRPNNISRNWIYLSSPVLDMLHAEGKPDYPKKNLWKQVWTGNQMDIQRRDRESNPGSVVHSMEEVPPHYLLPQVTGIP